MKKVDYDFGGGRGAIFLSMRTRRMFFMTNYEDRRDLHNLYGGVQYYSSRSGSSGAGYLVPDEDDLLEIKGCYRSSLTYLSEAWPDEILGIKVMVPVEGISYKSPAVVVMDGKIVFSTHPEQFVKLLLGETLEGVNQAEVKYRYLDQLGGISEFSIPWSGYLRRFIRGSRPEIPYTFEEFASCMGVIPPIHPTMVLEDEVSFIERKLHLAKTEVGLARIGAFGLPVEKIEGDLFPQDKPRHLAGWSTQGFENYQLAWKRVAGGEKVYAVIQTAVSGQLNEKYELLVENVLEWFNQPLEYWVEKMKSELTKIHSSSTEEE